MSSRTKKIVSINSLHRNVNQRFLRFNALKKLGYSVMMAADVNALFFKNLNQVVLNYIVFILKIFYQLGR
jgi:hypothetical protein